MLLQESTTQPDDNLRRPLDVLCWTSSTRGTVLSVIGLNGRSPKQTDQLFHKGLGPHASTVWSLCVQQGTRERWWRERERERKEGRKEMKQDKKKVEWKRN